MSAVSPDPASDSARPSAVRSVDELPDRDAEAVDGQHHRDEHEHGHGRATPEPPACSAETLTEAGDLLRALAAPVRISIVLQLRGAERCVHELVDALGVTQPLISQHLRVLKSAGVVSGQRTGREVVYRLVDEHLAHIVVDAVAHAEETTSHPTPRTGTDAEGAAPSRADTERP